MPSQLGLSVLAAAVLDRLRTWTPLTALVPVARIVDDVRSTMTYPFVLVESGSALPFNTLGAQDGSWGKEPTVIVRVVSQQRSDVEANTLMDHVVAALDGYRFTAAGYQPAIVTFENAPAMLKDTTAGVTTRELLAEFAATLHQ